MAYCRFSDGDVYMYLSIHGGIECCVCRLAKKVNTVFTKGVKNLDEDDYLKKLFKDIGPCEECKGKGCDACMMHGDSHFNSFSDAIKHLRVHKKAGHKVPRYAFAQLILDIKNGESIT